MPRLSDGGELGHGYFMPHRRTVLLIDDGEDEKILFERAWKCAGVSFELQCVGDGDSALAYLSGSGVYGDRGRFPFPDLAILDLNMPGLDGFDVLAWMRQQPICKDLPVLVLTSSSCEADVRRAYGLRASSYLVKPMRLADLSKMIKLIDDFWLKACLLPSWRTWSSTPACAGFRMEE